MSQPLCFVLMPFGEKPDATGLKINFDAVYRDLIAPAIRAAKLDPVRADEEIVGGIIHKPMFERLILCEYAVAEPDDGQRECVLRTWSPARCTSRHHGSHLCFREPTAV